MEDEDDTPPRASLWPSPTDSSAMSRHMHKKDKLRTGEGDIGRFVDLEELQ